MPLTNLFNLFPLLDLIESRVETRKFPEFPIPRYSLLPSK